MTILNEIARGINVSPGTAFIEGRQAAEQSRLAQGAAQRQEQQLGINQMLANLQREQFDSAAANARAAQIARVELVDTVGRRLQQEGLLDARALTALDMVKSKNEKTQQKGLSEIADILKPVDVQFGVGQVDGEDVFLTKDPRAREISVAQAPPGVKPRPPTAATQITITPENAINSAIAELFQEDIKKGSEAFFDLQQINLQRSVGLDTGPSAELKDQFNRVAATFGIESEAQLASIEKFAVFKSVTSRLLQQMMVAQKGPQTKHDVEMFKLSLANANNPEEANNIIWGMTETLARLKMARKEFIVKEGLKPGANLADVEGRWQEFLNTTPLMAQRPDGGVAFVYDVVQLLKNQNDMTDEQAFAEWRKAVNPQTRVMEFSR